MAKNNEKNFEGQMALLNEQINIMQEGICKLKTFGLRESVLYLLIQKASGTDSRGKPIPTGVIKAVMKGIEGLREYVFPE